MRPEVIMIEQLLTAKQVARALNVRPATIYAAAATGRIPFVRLWTGRRRALIRFRSEAIHRLIDERTFGADEKPSR